MDQTYRRTDRCLPILGITLIVEALATAGVRHFDAMDVGSVIAVLGAALGVVALLRHFRPLPEASWATAGFAVFAFAAMMLSDSYINFDAGRGGDPLRHLEFPAKALTVGGATLFWGAALARREYPVHEKLALLGRMGA